MNMNISISGSKLLLAGVGIAAAYAGWTAGSSIVHDTYKEDVFGDPTRPIEANGDTSIIQMRAPQGGKVTNYLMGAGAVAAFAGGALALGGQGVAATGLKSLLRLGGGVALAVGGAGAIAGAAAMNAQYSGADFLVER
jgi:hypothetical protein